MNKILKAGASSLLILLICFSIGEAMLRIYPAAIPVHYLVKFPPLLRSEIAAARGLPTVNSRQVLARDDDGPPLYLFKPDIKINHGYKDVNAVNPQHTDQVGFCNPQPNVFNNSQIDIIALGDSFTWCVAVEPRETWPFRLGTIVKQSTYNMGIPGIGIYEQLQILKGLALHKKPESVIINIYEGNDFRDAIKFWAYRERTSDEATNTKAHDDNNSNSSATFADASYFYQTLVTSAGLILFSNQDMKKGAHQKFAAKKPLSPKKPGKYGQLEQALMSKPIFPDFRYYLDFGTEKISFNQGNGDLDEANHAFALWKGYGHLSVFDQALRDFVKMSRQYGFKPIISYTPAAYSAYRKQVRFIERPLLEIMPFYSSVQRTYFNDRAKEFGYNFIDLTPALQLAAKTLGPKKLLYFPINRHLTPEGHEVIARELAARIETID